MTDPTTAPFPPNWEAIVAGADPLDQTHLTLPRVNAIITDYLCQLDAAGYVIVRGDALRLVHEAALSDEPELSAEQQAAVDEPSIMAAIR